MLSRWTWLRRRVYAWARALGRRRGRAVLGAFVVGFVGAALLSVVRGRPLPAVHDEFAYLLAAETFASGRLTNPTHPFWNHFETFHVIHQPTYQAKYPPGQSLVLSLGSLFGEPAVGLWISSGLLAATLLLALFSWLPRHWAILVAVVGTPHLVWFSYWGTTYWGGAVGAAGGALSMAGVGLSRGRFGPKTRWAPVLVAAGFGILALTRPFEGVLFAGALGLGEVGRLVHRRRGLLRPFDLRPVLASVVVLTMALVWFGYFNARVTGSAVTMPYQVHQQEYAATPSLITGGSGVLPEYRHEVMERYWREWGLERHEQFRERRGDPLFQLARAAFVLIFLFGPGLVMMTGALSALARTLRWVLTPALSLVVVLFAVLLTKGAYPHYAAPATASGLILAGAGLVGFRSRARWKGVPDITLVALLTWCLVPGLQALVSDEARQFAERRAEVASVLRESPEPDLVLVAYGPFHNVHREWVYNAADIDAAPIVWARSMGLERDRELVSYFGDRVVWCLEVDREVVLRRIGDLASCGPSVPK